jgi:hypothetical protein
VIFKPYLYRLQFIEGYNLWQVICRFRQPVFFGIARTNFACNEFFPLIKVLLRYQHKLVRDTVGIRSAAFLWRVVTAGLISAAFRVVQRQGMTGAVGDPLL